MGIRERQQRVTAPLARTICPACFHKSAYIKTTSKNYQIYLGCQRCCGRMVGERMVVRYLGSLNASLDITFQAPWTVHHLYKLIDLYDGTQGKARPTTRFYPILGVCVCPGCRELTSRIGKTVDNQSLYLSCTDCGGRVMGEQMAVRYLYRWVDSIEYAPGWSLDDLLALRDFYGVDF